MYFIIYTNIGRSRGEHFPKKPTRTAKLDRTEPVGSVSSVFGSGRVQNQILIHVLGRVSIALEPTETDR